MTHNVALFLDLDNMVIGAEEAGLLLDVTLILDHIHLLTQGRIVLRRAYGDWRQNQTIPRQLVSAGFELQSVVRLGASDKNLADIQMVVEALETLIDGRAYATYVIVTGDRDFMPLVQVLRRHDKTVIGVGIRHVASSSLVEICDRYSYYDDLVRTQSVEQEDRLEEWLRKAAELVFTEQTVRVPASLFRDHLQAASGDQFAQSPFARTGLGKLLERYGHIVRLERQDSTLFVCALQQEEVDLEALAAHYRSALKKRGLRVIPAEERLLLLHDVVRVLRRDGRTKWQQVVDRVLGEHAGAGRVTSRSMVNDVLRLARRARVIVLPEDSARPLGELPIALARDHERAFQEAVIGCDRAMLSELQALKEHPFDLRAAALALYDTAEREPYLAWLLAQAG